MTRCSGWFSSSLKFGSFLTVAKGTVALGLLTVGGAEGPAFGLFRELGLKGKAGEIVVVTDLATFFTFLAEFDAISALVFCSGLS